MKWITNENITEEILADMKSNIDKDLLIARLCSELSLTKQQLLSRIDEDELMLLVSTVLINRGLDNKETVENVFNKVHNSILSPYLLHNAELAADKILEYCLDRNAHIYIYADYDCDGITSGYVMFSALKEVCKGHISLRYPNRNEGYGLSNDFCDYLVNEHYDLEFDTRTDKVLVITVDNGISKRKEVKKLRDFGFEVVITDHHTSEEGFVPEDCIIVDPHNNTVEQSDVYNHLCGCGVAFKVAQIVQEKCDKFNMMNYTPYLAIATLADVMPMTNENLAFVQYGLEIINSKVCPKGIKTLKTMKGIDVVTANDILWTIAPMLNACGRMGDTQLASKLFFLDEVMTNEEIIKLIINVNENRKKLTKKAQEKIAELDFSHNNVCIYVTDEYPGGILGIIAGRVAESFTKPAIVVTKSKDGAYHGSVRSANGIDMLSLLKQLKELNLISQCGGHPGACVCTFELEQLNAIQEFFDGLVIEELYNTPVVSEPSIMVDEVISLGHLSEIVYAIVNILPCDNRTYQNPTFALLDLEVISFSQSKNNPSNIKFTVREGRITRDIWAWKFSEKYIDELGCPSKIHMTGEINKSFDGKYTLNVVDIMEA